MFSYYCREYLFKALPALTRNATLARLEGWRALTFERRAAVQTLAFYTCLKRCHDLVVAVGLRLESTGTIQLLIVTLCKMGSLPS